MKIGEITLRTAQLNLLEKLNETIKDGNDKAIFIFPTGLGKSYSAFAHALKFAGKKGRILILVHTEDLMKQHEKDFKKLNKTKSIGFLYKSQKDFTQDVIIANVRTLKNHLHKFKEDYFQYIIVDETHHATANSWDKILTYFKPKFLLGMTATPNIKHWQIIKYLKEQIPELH